MKHLKRKGFTLVELLISLALMSIVAIIVMQFFLSNNSSVNRTHIKSELQNEGQLIISNISTRLMEGEKISELKLEEDKVKIIVIDGWQKSSKSSYSLSGKILTYSIKEQDGTIRTRVIGENVEDIKVNYEGDEISKAKSIEIEVILSKKDIEYRLKDKIFLRNSK